MRRRLFLASVNVTSDPRFIEEPDPLTYIARGRPVTLHCKVVQANRVSFRCVGSWVDQQQHMVTEGIDPRTQLRYIDASIDVFKEQVEGSKEEVDGGGGGGGGLWCQCYAWADRPSRAPVVSRRAFVRLACESFSCSSVAHRVLRSHCIVCSYIMLPRPSNSMAGRWR